MAHIKPQPQTLANASTSQSTVWWIYVLILKQQVCDTAKKRGCTKTFKRITGKNIRLQDKHVIHLLSFWNFENKLQKNVKNISVYDSSHVLSTEIEGAYRIEMKH